MSRGMSCDHSLVAHSSRDRDTDRNRLVIRKQADTTRWPDRGADAQTDKQRDRQTYSFLSVKNLVGRAVCPPQRLRRTHKLRPH